MPASHRLTLLLLALLGLLALLALPARAQPLTITDALNRKVIVDVPAKRVVLGFNFEDFTAIAGTDGWKRVVGISKNPWAGWRPANWARYQQVIPALKTMPDVGYSEDNSFNAEKVIALKPDVLILPEGSFRVLGTAVQQITQAGIPIVVIDYNAQTLERHLASTRAIGAVMGSNIRAEELAQQYQRKYRDILRRVALARAGSKPRVYVELGRDGADSVGNTYRDTMWGKLLDTLGADNLANGRIAANWGPLNPEAVLAAQPDYIFIAGSSWVNRPKAVKLGYDHSAADARASLQAYLGRPGWSSLPAVRQQHVYAIEHGLCRSLNDYTAMAFIAKQLYPAQFADVDPLAELRQYHQRYLPVAYSGSWLLTLKP